MPDPTEPHRDGASSHIHIEKKGKGTNWLAWLLLALGILALLLALSRCNRDDTAVAPAVSNTADASQPTAAAGTGAVVATTPTAAAAGTSGLGAFLGGGDPTPRTFQFEKLNFDTGKSAVRPADAAEIDQIAAALKEYPNARVRIAGYADARGAEPANIALGKARAVSIKAALTGKGIDAGRIETASGGEQDPVDTNATASGRSENRRTELVVTAR